VLLSDQLASGPLCQQLARSLVIFTALMVRWLINVGFSYLTEAVHWDLRGTTEEKSPKSRLASVVTDIKLCTSQT
jgi:hypothetical protein